MPNAMPAAPVRVRARGVSLVNTFVVVVNLVRGSDALSSSPSSVSRIPCERVLTSSLDHGASLSFSSNTFILAAPSRLFSRSDDPRQLVFSSLLLARSLCLQQRTHPLSSSVLHLSPSLSHHRLSARKHHPPFSLSFTWFPGITSSAPSHSSETSLRCARARRTALYSSPVAGIPKQRGAVSLFSLSCKSAQPLSSTSAKAATGRPAAKHLLSLRPG